MEDVLCEQPPGDDECEDDNNSVADSRVGADADCESATSEGDRDLATDEDGECDRDAISSHTLTRATAPYLTKYERARVLGLRAAQISMNAPVLVDTRGQTDPLAIAMMELEQGRIRMRIRRYLPDKTFEDWGLDELVAL